MSKNMIIVYKGTITVKGEFHSGSGEADVTDHPLIRDTQGNVILRGESFAGLIRQELVRQFNFECLDYKTPGTRDACPCAVCSLMGHSRIPEKKNSAIFHSSRLKVTGGVFSAAASRIRHGVAIERRFQVAAQNKKHDREALLDGAKVCFELELENPEDKEITAVERVLLEMEKGLLSLGGKKGSGFGNYSSTYEKYEFDLTKREGVRKYLLGQFVGTPKRSTTDTKSFNVTDLSRTCDYRGFRLSVPFDLWFPELFLVNDPLEAALLGSDHVSVVDGEGNPWLPPSTIRGVFRSRTEQILRTLNQKAACDPSRDDDGKPLLSCATGIQKMKKDDKWPTWSDLERDDFMCLGCQLFGNTFKAGRIRFLPGSYSESDGHRNVLSHFLAVCRFSGGRKDGAKFDAWPLYDVHFRNCRIIIEDFHPWQIGLAALALKDFYQWDMRMGLGTRKGFGQVKCDFNDGQFVILSKPGAVYEIKLKDIRNGMFADVKNWLEGCVLTFRSRVSDFGGVKYDSESK